MKHRRSQARILMPDSGMEKSNNQVGILQPPPLIGFVKSVHPNQVGPPNGEVASLDAFPTIGCPLSKRSIRQIDQRKHPIDFAPKPTLYPVDSAPRMNRQPLVKDTVRQLGIEQHAIRSQEPTRFGKLLMDTHKVAGGDTVSIREHDIIGVRRSDGTIANGCSSKPTILMPNMCQLERCTSCKLTHDL